MSILIYYIFSGFYCHVTQILRLLRRCSLITQIPLRSSNPNWLFVSTASHPNGFQNEFLIKKRFIPRCKQTTRSGQWSEVAELVHLVPASREHLLDGVEAVSASRVPPEELVRSSGGWCWGCFVWKWIIFAVRNTKEGRGDFMTRQFQKCQVFSLELFRVLLYPYYFFLINIYWRNITGCLIICLLR